MMRWIILLVIVAAMITVEGSAQEAGGGESPRPKSNAAKQALLKRDRALEKADAGYRKSAAEAYKSSLVELKKAKDAAITVKNLEEANAVAAVIAETEQELERMDRKGHDRNRLAVDPTKGVWEHNAGPRGRYRADGTVRFDAWQGGGTWKVIDPHTIAQRDPYGACTITFSTDGRYSLWVYGPDKIWFAKRVE